MPPRESPLMVPLSGSDILIIGGLGYNNMTYGDAYVYNLESKLLEKVIERVEVADEQHRFKAIDN